MRRTGRETLFSLSSPPVDPNLGRFDPVTVEQGKAMADEIGALAYLEVRITLVGGYGTPLLTHTRR